MNIDIKTDGEWKDICHEASLELNQEHSIRFNKTIDCSLGEEPNEIFKTNKIVFTPSEKFHLWVRTPYIPQVEEEIIEEGEI